VSSPATPPQWRPACPGRHARADHLGELTPRSRPG
jgi:hypothetical protein